MASHTSQAQDSADVQLATVKQYCSGCHSDKLKTGGVSFEGITAAGATVKDAPHNVGGSRLVATFTDPDGNVLGLLQD